MYLGKLQLVIMFILFGEVLLALEQNISTLNESKEVEGSSRILSRRKRYLIFPDGSSFQMVFCAQNQGYLQIGDIVWFGNTAALAWELPADPKLFNYLKNKEKDFAQNRDGASKQIYFLNENGKVLSKVPYRKRILVNPAFAKRSVDENIKKLTVRELHEKEKKLQHFANLDKGAIDFHREGRKSFYIQLEQFIRGLGWSGRECVLRMLCEAGGGGTVQGTFLEEIMRATFTLPTGEFNSELHREYDLAHMKKGDCVKSYPECQETGRYIYY